MAKKGKEIEFGGMRIQVDPIVLMNRILMRQKKLLAGIALIGGIITVTTYLLTPKKYESRSNILIRYENFNEQYLQKLLNVAVGYLGSETEMMLTINELDLFADARARLPYDIALRNIQRYLKVSTQPRNIEVFYKSEDPVLAQRVVAFTTERLLDKMADLNETPHMRKLDAVRRALEDLAPKKDVAESALFQFSSDHNEIVRDMALGGLGGAYGESGDTIDDQIRQAERDLASARLGKLPETDGGGRNRSPEEMRLGDIKVRLDQALASYTENHPEVVRLKRAYADQQKMVELERSAVSSSGRPTSNVNEGRVATAKDRLETLVARKIDREKRAIGKPTLQRKWAELSLEAQNYSSQYRTLLAEREKIRSELLVDANAFQENFQLVDQARLPQLPSEPNKGKFAGLGMALTAMIGLLAAGLREALRQTFVDATEFEEQTGLQVFAALPTITKETP